MIILGVIAALLLSLSLHLSLSLSSSISIFVLQSFSPSVYYRKFSNKTPQEALHVLHKIVINRRCALRSLSHWTARIRKFELSFGSKARYKVVSVGNGTRKKLNVSIS